MFCNIFKQQKAYKILLMTKIRLFQINFRTKTQKKLVIVLNASCLIYFQFCYKPELFQSSRKNLRIQQQLSYTFYKNNYQAPIYFTIINMSESLNSRNLQKSTQQVSYNVTDGSNVIFLSYLRDSLASQLQKQLIYNQWLRQANRQKNQQESKIEQKGTNHQTNKVSSQQKQISEQMSDSYKQLVLPQKSQTKNISKNFGKAIITFIQNNPALVKKVLSKFNTGFHEFISALKARKKNLHTIAQLRALWLDNSFKYARVTRILSIYFLKRGSLKYIFSSKLKNLQGHIKYRVRLIEVLKNPKQFTSMKIY